MSWYFTNEEENYLKEHYTIETLYQMAKHLKRPKSSVGYHLQTVLQLKVPADVLINNRKERKEKAINKHDILKSEKLLLKALKKKKPSIKSITIKKIGPVKFISATHPNSPNESSRKPKTEAIKIPATTGLIPLRVDHRTIIYVKPGADANEILKQYQKKVS